MSFNVVQYQFICTMLYLCDKSSVCKLNKTGKYLANSLTAHQHTCEAEVDTLIHNLGS